MNFSGHVRPRTRHQAGLKLAYSEGNATFSDESAVRGQALSEMAQTAAVLALRLLPPTELPRITS